MPKVTYIMVSMRSNFEMSLFSLMSQDEEDIEVILINTDRGRTIRDGMDDSRVKVYNIPWEIAYNEGFKMAQGPVIGIQADDDISFPNRTDLLLEAIAGVDVVLGSLVAMPGREVRTGSLGFGGWRRDLWAQDGIGFRGDIGAKDGYFILECLARGKRFAIDYRPSGLYSLAGTSATRAGELAADKARLANDLRVKIESEFGPIPDCGIREWGIADFGKAIKAGIPIYR